MTIPKLNEIEGRLDEVFSLRHNEGEWIEAGTISRDDYNALKVLFAQVKKAKAALDSSKSLFYEGMQLLGEV